MSESKHPPKNKKSVRNIVYSFLVFYGSFYVFIAILDRSVLTHMSLSPRINFRDFLAIILSIAAAVVFYRWWSKRDKTTKAEK